jgi:hypothetical protein
VLKCLQFFVSGGGARPSNWRRFTAGETEYSGKCAHPNKREICSDGGDFAADQG